MEPPIDQIEPLTNQSARTSEILPFRDNGSGIAPLGLWFC